MSFISINYFIQVFIQGKLYIEIGDINICFCSYAFSLLKMRVLCSFLLDMGVLN